MDVVRCLSKNMIYIYFSEGKWGGRLWRVGVKAGSRWNLFPYPFGNFASRERDSSKRDSWPTVLFHRFNSGGEKTNFIIYCCIFHSFRVFYRTFPFSRYDNFLDPFSCPTNFSFSVCFSLSLSLSIFFLESHSRYSIKIYRRLNNIYSKSIEVSSLVIENFYLEKSDIPVESRGMENKFSNSIFPLLQSNLYPLSIQYLYRWNTLNWIKKKFPAKRVNELL